jgi:hypothetical protein
MALNDKDSEYLEQFELRQQTRAAIAGYNEVLKIRSCLPSPQYKVFASFEGMSDAARVQANRCNSQNRLRIDSYWNRGDWFPATGRTFETLFGMVWSKEPEYEIQPSLQFLIDNADGTGCGMREVAQKITAKVIGDGRYGIFVDMPSAPTDKGGNRVKLTRAQNESGEFLPKWIQYDPDQIFYTRKSGKSKSIDEIRLTELHSKKKNEFDWEDVEFTRRLIIIDGIFHNQLYNEMEELQYDITPVSDGAFMSEIPFQFFGADNNNEEYSKIALYGLARGNLKHFVQDCDNADNLHYHGQGMTVVSTDMSKEEFDDANPNGLDVGARGMNMLDAAGSVNVIQIEATGAIPAEMARKELRMIMSGAQLVTDNSGNETATAKRIDANASMSSLKRMSYNVSDGLKQLFVWTAALLGEESTSFYKTNTDFITDDLTPEMVKTHWEVVQSGGLPQVSFNETARKVKLTDKTDEELADAINDQQLLVGGTSEEQASIQAQLDAALEEIAALKASE